MKKKKILLVGWERSQEEILLQNWPDCCKLKYEVVFEKEVILATARIKKAALEEGFPIMGLVFNTDALSSSIMHAAITADMAQDYYVEFGLGERIPIILMTDLVNKEKAEASFTFCNCVEPHDWECVSLLLKKE